MVSKIEIFFLQRIPLGILRTIFLRNFIELWTLYRDSVLSRLDDQIFGISQIFII